MICTEKDFTKTDVININATQLFNHIPFPLITQSTLYSNGVRKLCCVISNSINYNKVHFSKPQKNNFKTSFITHIPTLNNKILPTTDTKILELWQAF
jgi:hypothetical protein